MRIRDASIACVCVLQLRTNSPQKHFKMTAKAERSLHIHVNFQFTLAGLSVLFDVFVHEQIERRIHETATGS